MIWKRSNGEHPNAIPFDSICPACGHRGCKLEFIPPSMAEGVRDIDKAMVKRICTTCGAECFQSPVLPPSKWIAK